MFQKVCLFIPIVPDEVIKIAQKIDLDQFWTVSKSVSDSDLTSQFRHYFQEEKMLSDWGER